MPTRQLQFPGLHTEVIVQITKICGTLHIVCDVMLEEISDFEPSAVNRTMICKISDRNSDAKMFFVEDLPYVAVWGHMVFSKFHDIWKA